MTAALTQLNRAVAATHRVNKRRFTESIVLFEMVNCFKMYVIKTKKEEKKKKKKKKKKQNKKEMKILK